MNAAPLRTLYLVRHCQAAGQARDAPLTPEGLAQAEILAERLAPLGPGRIISSPYRRARESIAPLAARLGIPVETDDRLVERVLSAEPLPDWRAQLRASFDDPDYHVLGGESGHAATARIVGVIAAILAGPTPAVIVTHGNALALLLQHYGGDDGFARWEGLTNPDAFRAIIGDRAATIARIWG